ncbi:hypothetical protein MPUL_14400 [Mycolicibacterium pulveris]|uniref:DNA topoisomerase (ATP-hydrolyzing) n=2 Tax=Mycolicibacterium pulveris TaxID=36813 RepID=A0A7I7UG45_MYCPV|nr:hypothetical protein MPUL_14400 [Mycolicibacterium pulveris]
MGGTHRCGDAPPDPLPGYDPFDGDADELPEAAHHGRVAIWAMIDAVVAELSACQEPNVQVTLLDDDGIQISDDGRGVPITLPHSVTAESGLAAMVEIETHRDGYRWLQQIGLGLPGIVERREPTTNTGTTVRCWVTPMFPGAIEYDALAVRLQHLAALNAGLAVTLLDQRPSPQPTRAFCCPAGLADYVRHLNRIKTPIQRTIIRFAERIGHAEVDVAAQWNAGYSESISTLADDNHPDYHTALRQGFRDALSTALQGYVDERIPLKAAADALVQSPPGRGRRDCEQGDLNARVRQQRTPQRLSLSDLGVVRHAQRDQTRPNHRGPDARAP